MSQLRAALNERRCTRDLIGVLPGEGIGPEVVRVALAVLATLGERSGRPFEIRTGGAIGKAAQRLHGSALSAETVDFCSAVFADGGALFCGPGSERFVYQLRQRYELYCKFTPLQPLAALADVGPLRPERVAGVDIIAVRENVAGVYFGAWGREGDDAFHRFGYSVGEVDRILGVALRLAQSRRGRLCLTIKREGVPSISALWLERYAALTAGSAVQCEVLDVDNAAYQLIADPQRFDVLVSSNMFGDILADTGSALLGSRGLSYSGNYGPEGRACYQTGHGAAWDLAGRDLANPVGQVLSLAMMLDQSYGWAEGAQAIRDAVTEVLAAGLRTADIAGPGHSSLGTQALGEALCEALRNTAGSGAQRRGGGKPVRTWLHRNPCCWSEVLHEVPLASADDVQAAAAQAVEAASSTQQPSLAQRGDALARWGHAIEAQRERMVALLIEEVGKPRAEAEAEVDFAQALLAHTRGTLGEEPTAEGRVQVRHRPLGAVGLITPFNNPLAIPVGKLAPALAHGNTVVWKPALPAPRLSALLMETLATAGLEGAVRLVYGDADTGRALVSAPGLAAISLTGAIGTGRQAAAACAALGRPLQAELGGNNAVLVFDPRQLSAIARQLAGAITSHAGQRCTAPRRLIVARNLVPEFEAALAEALSQQVIGHPAEPGTHIGPLISRQAQARMARLVTEAQARGARLVCGGLVPAGYEAGCWFAPTLLADAAPDSPLVREESFGPIAVLLAAQTFEHALQLCNAVPQGLAATLYSEDETQQQAFLAHAEAGLLALNHAPLRIAAEAPFAAWKASGLGPPEHGRWDTEFYTRAQALYRH